jgi:hypothetical protein
MFECNSGYGSPRGRQADNQSRRRRQKKSKEHGVGEQGPLNDWIVGTLGTRCRGPNLAVQLLRAPCPSSMSRPSRRQVYSTPPPEQVYASVPQASPPRPASSQGHGSSSQGHYYISQVGGPRPVPSRNRSRSNSRDGGSSAYHTTTSYHTSPHNPSRQTHRRTSGRTAVAQGVASGQIGSGYGPYSVRFRPLSGSTSAVF